jgi:protein kinase C substrate 80K-H
MAVKAAVVGYQEKYGHADASNPEHAQPEAGEPEGDVSEETLDELEKLDLDSLLMSGESFPDTTDDSHESARESLESDMEWEDADSGWVVYRIDQYIPDALYESYESVRDALLMWLIRFGVIGKQATQDASSSDAPRTSPFQSFEITSNPLSGSKRHHRRPEEIHRAFLRPRRGAERPRVHP